jgi:guanylate kinase
MSIEGGQIVTFVGHSGSGKTTQLRRLIEEPNFQVLRSVTTRPPRPSDVPGEYRYTTLEEHKSLAENSKFMWNILFGQNFYAKEFDEVELALDDPFDSYVNALVPRCAGILATAYGPERVRTFLLPNPGDDILTERMLARGDTEEAAAERLRIEAEQNWAEQAQTIQGLHVIQSTGIEQRHEEIMSVLSRT